MPRRNPKRKKSEGLSGGICVLIRVVNRIDGGLLSMPAVLGYFTFATYRCSGVCAKMTLLVEAATVIHCYLAVQEMH